jgi:hypothetical protein
MIEKVIRDGKVAILYSPGFGAGWSTWNTEYPAMIFDPEIVEAVEGGNTEKAAEIAERKYPECYTGGAGDLTISWLPVGTGFYIKEYDGSESVVTNNDFMTA